MGVTLLIVIALNYAVIGLPLYKRSASIEKKANAIIMSKSADDEFVLEIFKKEKRAVDKKIMVLNCISGTLVVLVLSWTAFGMVFSKK